MAVGRRQVGSWCDPRHTRLCAVGSHSGGQDGEKPLLLKVQIIAENPFSKLSAGRGGVRMS